MKIKTEECPFCNKKGANCCATWYWYCNEIIHPSRDYYLKDGEYVSNGNIESNILELSKEII